MKKCLKKKQREKNKGKGKRKKEKGKRKKEKGKRRREKGEEGRRDEKNMKKLENGREPPHSFPQLRGLRYRDQSVHTTGALPPCGHLHPNHDWRNTPSTTSRRAETLGSGPSNRVSRYGWNESLRLTPKTSVTGPGARQPSRPVAVSVRR